MLLINLTSCIVGKVTLIPIFKTLLKLFQILRFNTFTFRLKDYIEERKQEVQGQQDDMKEFMNNWILNLRKINLLSQ